MGSRCTRLVLFGALGALALLAPATATAQNGSVQPRIVGGSTSSISQYPWQAAVVLASARFSGSAHQRQFCGGSLITSRIVVTAAHCVYDSDPDCIALCSTAPVCNSLTDTGGDGTCKLDPNDVDAVLGRTTLSGTDGAEITVQSVTYRPDYDPNYQGDGVPRNDVAYLVLSAPSTQTPIDIAGSDEGALWAPGSSVDISGWGSTHGSGNTVDTLRAATVEIISDSTCGSPSIYGSDFDATTMVCAGYLSGGIDTCQGDSGGPLEAPLAGGGYRLVGITGWGYGCAQANAPGVYTRVAGSTLRPEVVSDVNALETANGLAHEGITGGGGSPKTSTGTVTPVTSQPTAAVVGRYAKCKRIHSKKKRRRCVRKVKARLSG